MFNKHTLHIVALVLLTTVVLFIVEPDIAPAILYWVAGHIVYEGF